MAAKNGNLAISIALLCFSLLLTIKISESATFNVGDDAGWDFGAEEWSKGKKFQAGDELVFIYPVGAHNVVVVNADGYDNCSPPSRAKKFTSGNDTIKLVKGDNYFLCDFPSHCSSGMRIGVTAT